MLVNFESLPGEVQRIRSEIAPLAQFSKAVGRDEAANAGSRTDGAFGFLSFPLFVDRRSCHRDDVGRHRRMRMWVVKSFPTAPCLTGVWDSPPPWRMGAPVGLTS